jgi:DNA-binding transcriptional LysR family regulator
LLFKISVANIQKKGGRMEWQQIIGFYHVAKLKSFTQAAEATFRTQSALTQQIKALEKEFDCQFFERIGKRKVVLTSVGERFYGFAESLLFDYNQLREDISEHKGLKKGRLRIAAPFTTLYHLLPEIVRNYSKQFPWVELSLFDRPQREVVELVKSGDVDLGMALESTISRELKKRRWKLIEPVLLMRKGHPLSKGNEISIVKIAQYPLILPPKGSESLHRNKLDELFRKYNAHHIVVMESSNIELSSRYVEMGLGVSFASIVKDLPIFKGRKLEYVSLSQYFTPEYVCIVTRKDKRMTSFQNSFLHMLFET